MSCRHVCISFAKQNDSSDCSSLEKVVTCFRVLVNEVHCKECEWKYALRSQSLVSEARWLSDSLRDITYNIHRVRTSSTPVHWTRHYGRHVQRTVSHWFHGNTSKFDIDMQEMIIISAVLHNLLPLINHCHRQIL